ncbi:hypothetical protein, partial [Thiolapillus sp.]
MPQTSWSPSTTQQLRKLVAAPYLAPNDWTPRLDAYFASPLALCARRVSSAASRLLGTTSLRFALHGWQRRRPFSYSARRYGRAFSCLTARGGGLPSFNYRRSRTAARSHRLLPGDR